MDEQEAERRAKLLSQHGVALAVITAHDGLPVIIAQCECGWRARFAEVTTFNAVFDRVTAHQAYVLGPVQ